MKVIRTKGGDVPPSWIFPCDGSHGVAGCGAYLEVARPELWYDGVAHTFLPAMRSEVGCVIAWRCCECGVVNREPLEAIPWDVMRSLEWQEPGMDQAGDQGEGSPT